MFVCASGALACQLPVCSAQSGKKAKPNYRHTATDLAGMLTRTGVGEEREEGSKGGDGLEKSRLDSRFTRADRRDQAEGLGGVGHYFRIWCSHYLSSRKSGRGKKTSSY